MDEDLHDKDYDWLINNGWELCVGLGWIYDRDGSAIDRVLYKHKETNKRVILGFKGSKVYTVEND